MPSASSRSANRNRRFPSASPYPSCHGKAICAQNHPFAFRAYFQYSVPAGFGVKAKDTSTPSSSIESYSTWPVPPSGPSANPDAGTAVTENAAPRGTRRIAVVPPSTTFVLPPMTANTLPPRPALTVRPGCSAHRAYTVRDAYSVTVSFVASCTPSASSHHPVKSYPSRSASGSHPYASPIVYPFVLTSHVPPFASNFTTCVP